MPRQTETSSGTRNSSRRRATRGKKELKTVTNFCTNVAKSGKRRTRSSMIKREPPFLPDIGSLTRLPLATSRGAAVHTEMSSRDDDSDCEELTLVRSDSEPHRPISLSSGSRTPSASSVVDLTNDSGMEDDGVVDLTTSFQMPSLGSTISVSSGGHSVSAGVGEERRGDGSTAAEVVVLPESDDDVLFVSSTHPLPPPPPPSNSVGSSLPDPSPPPNFLGLLRPHLSTSPDSKQTSEPSTSTSSDSQCPSPSLSPVSTGKASITCPICMDRATQFESAGRELMTTVCGHVFCDKCIRNAISSFHKCPVCNKKLTLRQFHRLFIQ